MFRSKFHLRHDRDDWPVERTRTPGQRRPPGQRPPARPGGQAGVRAHRKISRGISQRPGSAAPACKDLTMKKILIIEDDQLVANIYRNKFSMEGFMVEVALDGESGLELVNTFRPAIVILDLMLPKVTGLDLLKKIRSQPAFKHLPIIVFSNTYLSNMVQEAWKAGATKCLSNANCTPKQVIEVVRNAITATATAAALAESQASEPALPAEADPSPEENGVAFQQSE